MGVREKPSNEKRLIDAKALIKETNADGGLWLCRRKANRRGSNRGCRGSGQMPGVQTSLLGARTLPREERSLLQAPAYERR